MIPPGIHIHVDDALRALGSSERTWPTRRTSSSQAHDETDLRREEVFSGGEDVYVMGRTSPRRGSSITRPRKKGLRGGA